MPRSTLLTSVAFLTLIAFWIPACQAAHVGKVKNKRKNDASDVQPVDWAKSIAEAAHDAKKADVPFLIFFCSEEAAAFAGNGSRAVEKYSKTVAKMPPHTIFEADAVVETLDALEYPIAKVVASPQTAEIARKYKVTASPALIACEPEGAIIGSLQGDQLTQTNAIELLKGLKDIYAKWKKANADKVAPRQPEAATPHTKQPEATGSKAANLPDDAP